LKLKDAAHVLDDILDECATQALELEYKAVKGGPSHMVQSSFLSSLNPKHVAFRYKIAKKMKNIRERLNEIAEERTKFHLTEIVREKRSGVLDWRQTTSIISQPRVYGRDEHKDKIVDFLVGDASQLEDLPVYPIIGLGGLEDFTLKRMTKAIIESATKKAYDVWNEKPQKWHELKSLLACGGNGASILVTTRLAK
ncbi:NB-ARC domain disease resistance protein, partial [Trifolium medium]|nr:NB-ARC domain disease resistance protein [Trifolium medium]